MANTVGASTADPGWLRSQQYDLTLIRDITFVALLSGVAVTLKPELFVFILVADLWLLGYHHVISTMTRLTFDGQSLRQHKFLIFVLPLLVFGATFLLAWHVGIWLITTIYLYWQWFHYTRQSWGISQAYRRKAGERANTQPLLALATFYLVPAYGILYRSWQAPSEFLFQNIRVLPVPEFLVDFVGALALLTTSIWGITQYRAWRSGRLARAHAYFVLSHFTIFLVGYRLIEDITHGWLVINIWHNAQYILFVWLFNTNRFKGGINPSARFLSWISQSRNKFIYFAVCLAISTTVYAAVSRFVGTNILAGLPLALVVYQAINFHHYIVDSLIWKMRKKPLQQNLGLP